MRNSGILRVFTGAVLVCSLVFGQAAAAYADSSDSLLTSGGNYYQYQWGLKNNGNIQRTASGSSDMEVRRSPGEERRQPPSGGGGSQSGGRGDNSVSDSGGGFGGNGSGGQPGGGGGPGTGSFGRFSEEDSAAYIIYDANCDAACDEDEITGYGTSYGAAGGAACSMPYDKLYSGAPAAVDWFRDLSDESPHAASAECGTCTDVYLLTGTGSSSETTVVQAVEDIDINVEPAWDYYEQTSSRRTVTVAIIDTGVDITHSELEGAIWVNEDEIAGDGIDNDGNGYIDDVNGWNFYSDNNQVYVGEEDDHGTHGAGTIAAAWDGTGTVGIADSTYVKIMPLKVFGSDDATGNLSSVKEAIRYAEANGADICNLSLGATGYDSGLEELMNNSSMLFVVSAGNGDTSGTGYDIDTYPVYPAAFSGDNIITVANLMFDGTLSKSSNYGTVGVDVAAPGTYILSTEPGGSYGFMSGTSMSAPMVTGIAALIYSCRTDMSIMDVRTAILSTARELTDLDGKILTGGIPDTYAAITYGL